jgi:enoyl-CoA hydratase/carnithine racemase
METIRLEAEPPLGRITLNRPEKLNALSPAVLMELAEAARELDGTRDVKVVVVAGAGRAFSAGFDLDSFATGTASVRETADLGRLMAEAITGMRALTIASIQGRCVGGGLVLAAACDLRVAATDAIFSIPEVDLGIPLAWGGIPRLVRELGPAITKELVLTCREFGAEEARALRFLNRTEAPEALASATEALAHELAAKPGFALRTTKQQVNAVLDEIAGVGRNASDADILASAVADPESQEAALRYLAERGRARGDS